MDVRAFGSRLSAPKCLYFLGSEGLSEAFFILDLGLLFLFLRFFASLCLSLLVFVFLCFLRSSSLLFVFVRFSLILLEDKGKPLQFAVKNDTVCTDPMQNFPIYVDIQKGKVGILQE